MSIGGVSEINNITGFNTVCIYIVLERMASNPCPSPRASLKGMWLRLGVL